MMHSNDCRYLLGYSTVKPNQIYNNLIIVPLPEYSLYNYAYVIEQIFVSYMICMLPCTYLPNTNKLGHIWSIYNNCLVS
jgi:hypothetical protein